MKGSAGRPKGEVSDPVRSFSPRQMRCRLLLMLAASLLLTARFTLEQVPDSVYDRAVSEFDQQKYAEAEATLRPALAEISCLQWANRCPHAELPGASSESDVGGFLDAPFGYMHSFVDFVEALDRKENFLKLVDFDRCFKNRVQIEGPHFATALDHVGAFPV